MKFEWDEQKNQLNIEHHEIDFNDVYMVFDNPMLKRIDNRKDYGEERWISLGKLDGVVVVVVYTVRKDVIRIISVRRGNRNERKIYETQFGKQN
ncbi:MAG: BrnT family toxin [Proteobacteria bacterium]|nr:BrnT family toxin [Pseudomonadota bacterium]